MNINLPAEIAKHFRELHFGGNWTDSSFKDHLAGVDWQLATKRIYSLNTIADLVFHTNYYVSGVTKVLEGGPLESSDKFSFACPPIRSEDDWQQLLEKFWSDAEKFAGLIEQLQPDRMGANLADEKYGHYYRNLLGIIEHSHYHLGQLVLIKKVLLQKQGLPEEHAV
jgi:hypothetical protein